MFDLDKLPLSPFDLALGSAFSLDEKTTKLLAILSHMSSNGHLCLPLDELSESDQNDLLSLLDHCPSSLISKTESSKATPLYFTHNCLYLHKGFRAETTLIYELTRFLKTQLQEPLPYSPCLSLNDRQNEALYAACKPGLLLLTGGPGTGKTFTAKKIAQHLLANSKFFKPVLILAAPTSKALDQLKKSIGPIEGELIAMTLHKLVNFRSKKPAYLNGSCIIVDEASMIEASVMAKFFSACGSGAKVILMGDPHQLPPIGLGSVFQDLLEVPLEKVHHVHLTQGHRFKDLALIKLTELIDTASPDEFIAYLKNHFDNLKLIDEPLVNFNPTTETIFSDFFSEECFHTDHLELSSHTINSVILSTLRKGPLGVDQINERLSTYFKNLLSHKRYYIEPIMILENQPTLNLFNGETGVKVYNRQTDQIFYHIKGQNYPSLTHYAPAFALSVHKSQGSEYNKVLFMLPNGSEKFSREIIYTAITRVKKQLFIWLDEEPLKIALSKKNKRYSGLKYRL